MFARIYFFGSYFYIHYLNFTLTLVFELHKQFLHEVIMKFYFDVYKK